MISVAPAKYSDKPGTKSLVRLLIAEIISLTPAINTLIKNNSQTRWNTSEFCMKEYSLNCELEYKPGIILLNQNMPIAAPALSAIPMTMVIRLNNPEASVGLFVII